MVLGEPQILGQVAEAHTQALRAGSTGLVLSHLFQFAIRTGKRARHETAIGVNPATVSSVAVHRIARLVPSLANAQVLVVGAGEMAELAVEALRRRSVDRLTVINRTVDRASSLADRWGARSRPFEALFDELAAADVVLTSTAAPHTIVHRAMVEAAMAGRSQRPMVVVDLAVPRDVEPAVGLIPGVHLLDIDELGREVSESVRSRESEVPLVEALIAEELNSFLAWYRTLEIRPVIKAMRGRAERIRQRTVKRALRRLPRLGKAERAEIELLTKALVNKLLHDPTSQLRTLSQNGQAGSYALLARELFGLREEEDTDSG
jgi:glutamyl-tRNA reductase